VLAELGGCGASAGGPRREVEERSRASGGSCRKELLGLLLRERALQNPPQAQEHNLQVFLTPR